ncbi:trace amine-associated receptor 13c-like [Kryptolebias marmoratus]|uniref:trace amine-associated receptor 13c-like n=1 Tax=Kryptolebias marmoratus TaxID=37003 RepID=UPI0007F92F5D|nr:trace amine-associated receptor 13c-like [Kryptolebias marmoratus]
MMETQEQVKLCFPQLLNSSCRKPTLDLSEAVLLMIVMPFISLITVVLNLLIIISVSHFRQLQTPTNILLLSLAVLDFFTGFLTIPVEIFRSTTCWILGDILCLVYCYVVCLVLTASTVNIVLIVIDRYVAICDPLHYPTRITMTRVKYCVCLCWLLSAFYSIFYFKDLLNQPSRTNFCIGKCALPFNKITGTIDLILNCIFPVVICVLFTKVIVVAVSQACAMRSRITAGTFPVSMNLKSKNSELKAARTLGVFAIVYLISFCPYYWYSVVQTDLTGTSYATYLFFLFYFNSCLNPVIYALFYPRFRKALKLTVTLQILQPGSCDAKIL